MVVQRQARSRISLAYLHNAPGQCKTLKSNAFTAVVEVVSIITDRHRRANRQYDNERIVYNGLCIMREHVRARLPAQSGCP